ncbi:MAG: (E)-4-hydroxy-3-methylbut-2-enyl-diphosphate synthase [Muribaculaceae bacterium]|nr:(E)-4-hydroxy-3-methylbut-2-enyl-diphosphate synthase [Muribaculaceae bacterium]
MGIYKRRATWPVNVAGVTIGGDSPIRVQSMTSTSTMDTEASVEQAARIAEAGGELVRLTAQGVREAANMAEIKKQLQERGINVPLVADIHFNPKAAFEAALHVDKVRINPGNFVDPGRVFKHIDYTDEEYASEQERIAKTLIPFFELCRKKGTSVRIGVNHGSLSDRIMSRYGDTPAGIVESAMEFLRIALSVDFRDIVISIKASNTVLMVETVKMLVAAMERENMAFPLHLGVTEAGDGDDGRIKSAVGIGTLLHHGIGDTIRVSLSEEPECEIPVARALVDYIAIRHEGTPLPLVIKPERFPSRSILNVGGGQPIVAVTADNFNEFNLIPLSADMDHENLETLVADSQLPVILSTAGDDIYGNLTTAITGIRARSINTPLMVSLTYNGLTPDEVKLRAAADAGALLLDCLVDGIRISSDALSHDQIAQLELDILQAARCRFSKTEFISCPGCGRTLFNLQSTVAQVKNSLSHLTGLKIAVMGCIVNGPGEMSDADYGYVGAASGKVSLYRNKECVEKNIPQEEALEHLINLLKKDGKWRDPEK